VDHVLVWGVIQAYLKPCFRTAQSPGTRTVR
jgi:hypothetical protein